MSLARLLAAALLGVAASAGAATKQATVTLVAEETSLVPGESTTLGLRFDLAEHWHVYWSNPGDSGKAPSVAWTLPAGFAAGVIEWPAPQRPLDTHREFALELVPAAGTPPDKAELAGVVVIGTGDATRAHRVVATPPSTSLPLILLLAATGGLLLNLMPCVFPVLSLKVLSFVQHTATRSTVRGMTRRSLAPAPGLLALALAACGGDVQSERAGAPPPVVVEIAVVETATIEDGLELTGQLEADESVMVRAETAGVIDAVAFEEGQEIARGALLFRLRDAEQRAQLREAEAQRTLTEQTWRRASTLAGTSVLSAADLDLARANRDAARARVDLARVALERTTILAPFDGTLGTRLVSPGDRITDQTDLVQLDATARLKLTFTLPEHAVELVRQGQAVEIHVAPFPDRRFPGTVFFVAPSLDPRNRRLTAKAAIDNPERLLRPGLFASVRLETARRPGALVVPESAIVYDTEGPFVWRLTPEATAERAGVGLGTRRDGRVEVTAGLAAGDRVVSAGTNKVVPARPLAAAGAS